MASVFYFEGIFLCVFLSSIVKSHPITFGIVEPYLNQVIFDGEENLTMECKVSVSQNASMEIVFEKNVVAYNNYSGNVVKYVIPTVSSEDSGNYTCLVTYLHEETGKITDSVNFLLRVHNRRPQCAHNGTNGNSSSFYVGDEVTLSCYCMASDNCRWNERNVTEEMIGSAEVINGSKSIVTLQVGPLSINDNNTVLDCSYGPTDSQRCSIGPLLVLSVTTNDVTVVNNSKKDKMEERTLMTILLVLLLFILILLIVRFLLCLCCNKTKHCKREKLKQNKDDITMTEDGTSADPQIDDTEQETVMHETDFRAQPQEPQENIEEETGVLETNPLAQPRIDNIEEENVMHETELTAQSQTDDIGEETMMLETDSSAQPQIDDMKDETVVLETHVYAQVHENDGNEDNTTPQVVTVIEKPQAKDLEENTSKQEYDTLLPQTADRPKGAPQSPKPTDRREPFSSYLWKSVGFLNFHKAFYE